MQAVAHLSSVACSSHAWYRLLAPKMHGCLINGAARQAGRLRHAHVELPGACVCALTCLHGHGTAPAGEVVDIERHNNRTEVVVDEGINQVSYALDESLIYFGAALEDQDYDGAAAVSSHTVWQWQCMWPMASGKRCMRLRPLHAAAWLSMQQALEALDSESESKACHMHAYRPPD